MAKLKALIDFASKPRQVPILSTIAVNGGSAIATDIDIVISASVENVDDGVYNPFGFNIPALRKKEEMPLSDFPEGAAPHELLGNLQIKIDDLKFVSLTQSNEETRYYLQGICFSKDKMVATDGHRLNLANLDVEAPEGDLIIPKDTVSMVLKCAIETRKKDFDICFYKNRAVISIGYYQIITKYIDGTYPDFRRVIPSANPLQTNFRPSEIKNVLPTLVLLAKQSGAKSNPLCIQLENNKGSYKDFEFPITSDFTVKCGFNAHYLASACDGIAHYSDEKSPMLIINSAAGYQSVVMPMKY